MDIEYNEFKTKAELYSHMNSLIGDMINECDDEVALLSNISGMINLFLERINWAGFYLMKNGHLVLGPYQGKPAVAVIEVGKGVCGTAVLEDKTQIVEDTHLCCNHIACDAASRSEIVTPIHANGTIYGVIDIDAPVVGRFDDEDKKGFELLADTIGKFIER